MKLSIIIAVYNTSKYLEQCLDSIFNQTMPKDEYEVIIVNDCSTDNSIDLINCKVKGFENVKVVDKKVNEATFWSRVDGIILAKGDYVGFVDSDDWVELDMYETMVRKGIESGADVVECGTFFEYDDGRCKYDMNRAEYIESAADKIKKHMNDPVLQVALYLRIFSRKVIDRFINEQYPYFNDNRQKYCGVRNEDDLLFPLFLSNAQTVLNIQETFCRHRAEIPDSTMDLIRKNPKKYLDACIYRVDAGFDVMQFTKNQKEIYPYIEHNQINVIFGLLGKLLETDYYSYEDSRRLLKDAIKRMNKETHNLAFKDKLRFLHLKLKTLYCYH